MILTSSVCKVSKHWKEDLKPSIQATLNGDGLGIFEYCIILNRKEIPVSDYINLHITWTDNLDVSLF